MEKSNKDKYKEYLKELDDKYVFYFEKDLLIDDYDEYKDKFFIRLLSLEDEVVGRLNRDFKNNRVSFNLEVTAIKEEVEELLEYISKHRLCKKYKSIYKSLINIKDILE
jgi:hypothetical protein